MKITSPSTLILVIISSSNSLDSASGEAGISSLTSIELSRLLLNDTISTMMAKHYLKIMNEFLQVDNIIIILTGFWF